MSTRISLWPLIKKLQGANIYNEISNQRWPLESVIKKILENVCGNQGLAKALNKLLKEGEICLDRYVLFVLKGPKWPNSQRTGYRKIK